MKYLLGKCPIRLSSLIELACLYFGSFLLAGFLAYIERSSTESYVLERYLKFIVEHQTALIFALSTLVIVYHYQGIVKAETEIACRIIVGDRLGSIRFRYGLGCFVILASCFLIMLIIHILLDLKINNFLNLFGIFFVYICASSLVLGKVRRK